MPALIGHAVFGRKLIDKYFQGIDEARFYVGTTFPDIRNLGVIPRDQTHTTGIKLVSLQVCENAFDLGFKAHSLVDETHFRFMQQNGIYNFGSELRFAIQALKVYEDRLLYQKLNNWIQIAEYFTEIFDEEKVFQIDLYDIRRWHNYIKRYFFEGPSDNTARNFNAETGFPSSRAEELLKTLEILKSDKKYEDTIFKFYDRFDELVLG
ncbi:MAG: hypothetical protein UX31_C0003G0041 [Candidatus Nomurabacteria bacterium GW2011_GWA1_46_11]|uniref:Uncharacterized protein n=1 Tax=Candidatus Nomurabacteria bacterium GW2011_GWA1_46_11 TaxID=1618732 RepID=A0A0G1RN71_9BACT|nr:MAG: hypothetical protein UW69_C0026G0018 [Microgenomates group bacterium GW2011_GWA2_44_7]KKT78317.1 MAG: hypothetical protein UW73_C0004G0041 [Microgenomates group bacterium GW2011_GWB1_44_8]KKU22375.1 MAG: hypothetical protein UX31_C0003G0041 [Candidatus Nomurabacteria bacterium GW2011_GWA1_46_11]